MLIIIFAYIILCIYYREFSSHSSRIWQIERFNIMLALFILGFLIIGLISGYLVTWLSKWPMRKTGMFVIALALGGSIGGAVSLYLGHSYREHIFPNRSLFYLALFVNVSVIGYLAYLKTLLPN